MNLFFRFLMCFRFESKHQQIKGYTNVCFNRRNICLSAARKLCYQFSSFIVNYKRVEGNINSFEKSTVKPEKRIIDLIKRQNPGELSFGSKVVFKGTTFRIGDFIVEKDYGILITNIVMVNHKIILVYKKVHLEFDYNLRWHKIVSYQEVIFFEYITSFEYGPVKKHTFNKSSYIKRIKK